MNYFTKKNRSTVGSYKPSENWNKYTQFAVMDEKTGELIATTGYFQHLTEEKEWCFDDYKHAAECIEQAQLYANAPKLFELVKELLFTCQNSGLVKKGEVLINQIVDISEPVNRLLGKDAIRILEEIKIKEFDPF